MSCNIRIPIQQIIDDVAAALSGRYISTDNPFLNEAVLTDTTLRGDLTLDTEARDALCTIITTCSITAAELEWLAQPTGANLVAISSLDGSEVVTTWKDIVGVITTVLEENPLAITAGDVIVSDGVSQEDLNSDFSSDIESQKLDTGITATAKFGGVERILSNKLTDNITISDFGNITTNNATLNTAIFNEALSQSVTNNFTLHLDGSQTYLVEKLTIPASTKLKTNGATFLVDGEHITNDTSDIVVGVGAVIDELNIYNRTPHSIGKYVAKLMGDNKVDTIKIYSDSPNNENALSVGGSNITIRDLDINNFNEAVDIEDSNLSGFIENIQIENIKIRNYRRGVFLNGVKGFFNSAFDIRERNNVRFPLNPDGSENTTVRSGGNCFLIQASLDWHVGDGVGGECDNGFLRVGGTPPWLPLNTGCHNFSIGHVVVYTTGNTGIKLNANNGREYATNGTIGSIVAYDLGRGGEALNQSLLRFSHVKNITVGRALALPDKYSVGAHALLELNDADGVTIDTLGGVTKGGIIINEEQDIDFPEGETVAIHGGDVKNIRIGTINSKTTTAGNFIDLKFAAHALNNVSIDNMNIEGFTSGFMYQQLDDTDYDSAIIVSGNIKNTTAVPRVWGKGNLNTVVFSGVNYNGTVFNGNASKLPYALKAKGIFTATEGLAIGDVDPSQLVIDSANIAGAVNKYGGALEFTRLNSTKRGAVLAAKQTGASTTNVGIAILVNTASADNTLQEIALFNSFGHLTLPFMPSTIGSVATNTLYAEADGIVRIKRS